MTAVEILQLDLPTAIKKRVLSSFQNYREETIAGMNARHCAEVGASGQRG